MNEECLLKYLLNPNELEILTEFLQNVMQNITKNETAIVYSGNLVKNF